MRLSRRSSFCTVASLVSALVGPGWCDARPTALRGHRTGCRRHSSSAATNVSWKHSSASARWVSRRQTVRQTAGPSRSMMSSQSTIRGDDSFGRRRPDGRSNCSVAGARGFLTRASRRAHLSQCDRGVAPVVGDVR